MKQIQYLIETNAYNLEIWIQEIIAPQNFWTKALNAGDLGLVEIVGYRTK